MRRLLACCAASLLIYGTLFACVLDRPLTLGVIGARIDATLRAGAAIHEPKLVILAGSNGPYSHRCETIAPLIGRPCINGGIAVGIGLDYLFARWQPLLHAGDMVYLPLEEAQYIRSADTAALGPDAAIMLRHDRATLLGLPARRQVAALFSSDLRAGIMSLIETALVAAGWADPRLAATGGTNDWGDHIGHTAVLAAANQASLAAIVPYHPAADQIRDGFGTAGVAAFLRWANTRGVRAIGGLPTGFADSPIGDDALAAIRSVYRDNGAAFLELPNRSRYPRTDFFNTQDHLDEPAQIRHSVAVAAGLRDLTQARSRQ